MSQNKNQMPDFNEIAEKLCYAWFKIENKGPASVLYDIIRYELKKAWESGQKSRELPTDEDIFEWSRQHPCNINNLGGVNAFRLIEWLRSRLEGAESK
jgi:hypothetical protein